FQDPASRRRPSPLQAHVVLEGNRNSSQRRLLATSHPLIHRLGHLQRTLRKCLQKGLDFGLNSMQLRQRFLNNIHRRASARVACRANLDGPLQAPPPSPSTFGTLMNGGIVRGAIFISASLGSVGPGTSSSSRFTTSPACVSGSTPARFSVLSRSM